MMMILVNVLRLVLAIMVIGYCGSLLISEIREMIEERRRRREWEEIGREVQARFEATHTTHRHFQ